MTNAMAREILRLTPCTSTANFPFPVSDPFALSYRSPLHASARSSGKVGRETKPSRPIGRARVTRRR